MEEILASPGEFEWVIGNYDTPQGAKAFIGALAELFRGEFGWDIGPENIALTNGSQNAFFSLFNLFAGKFTEFEKQADSFAFGSRIHWVFRSRFGARFLSGKSS